MKCYNCNVGLEKAKTNFEYQGVIIPDMPCLKCPKCGEKLFSPEEVRYVRERLAGLLPRIKYTRKISKAGNRPVLYLPENLIKFMNLKVREEVTVYPEGKKRIVIEMT
ncbi:MAG: YgiT-type zinc finger protein [Euryarchaeota archaeon]|nr:YgiT-type zinc finger protein [Euryarchaeota archaeon]